MDYVEVATDNMTFTTQPAFVCSSRVDIMSRRIRHK